MPAHPECERRSDQRCSRRLFGSGIRRGVAVLEAHCRMVDRCQRPVDVTNLFVIRDFELIALSRRAIATVDLFQDVITAYQTALPCTKTLT